MRRWNVGIIGGGPGGLLTAYFLRKAADSFIEITIFEASDRLGGKIETCRFDSADAIYEAGAAELYDYSPVDEDPLRQLVAELGLSIHPMGGSAVILGENVVANLDDLRDLNGSPATDAMVEFDRFARDAMSPREFFDSDHLETPR
ncbi:MAG: NAD(P)-binding protein, partial [Planctomycetota bacterium]|nr:NAD(P)-binding protein [Planctomycetota bacterium]